jgi:Ca-activated chloride channel family protein
VAKGYNRPFWLKHHVFPPLSPSVADLQTIAVPLPTDATGFDRWEQLAAQGRRPSPREIRVEDFIAHAQSVLPAAPVGNVQLQGWVGRTPYAPSAAVAQFTVQTGAAPVVGGTHRVIAVDRSASMLRQGRWAAIERVLTSLPERMSANDELSLVVFGDEPELIANAVTVADADLWRRTVTGVRPFGGADLAAGLRAGAMQTLESTAAERRELVLISDHDGQLPLPIRRGLAELIRDVAAAGVNVSVIDLSATKVSALSQASAGTPASRWSVETGEPVATPLARWLEQSYPVVATDAQFQVAFNPQTVQAYRLIGNQASSWSRVTSAADPVDLPSGTAASVLFEILPQPSTAAKSTGAAGDKSWLAEGQLTFRLPATGEVRQQKLRLETTAVAANLADLPPLCQRCVMAAELAEIVAGTRDALRETGWNGSEPHDVAAWLATQRNATSSVRLDPAFQRLVRWAEALRKLGQR